MRRYFYIIVFTIFLTSTASAAEPVNIGLTLGFSGSYKELADMCAKGLKLWEEHVNSKNGLLGRKVQFTIYDDKSDGDTARNLYKKLIVEDKVDLLLGPYSSKITAAVLPVVEQYGYPLLFIGAAADSLWAKGYKNAFGVFTPASRYTMGFLEMLAMKGISNVAIVYADDIFSSNIATGAKDWSTQFGLTVKLYDEFKKGKRDLSPFAKKAKKLGAEALIVCGHFNEAVDMRKALTKINWVPKAYFATVGPATDAFQTVLKNDAELVFSSSQWEPAVSFQPDDHEIFLKPFEKKYNTQPSYHAAQAFAVGQILAKAVIRANSMDKDKIRYQLATMDAMNIIGRYKVDKTGKQTKHFQITIQRQNGKKEVVWPESLATASPVFR